MSRLYILYKDVIIPQLMKDFSCGLMATPKIEKIVLNMGLSASSPSSSLLKNSLETLTLISGQRPLQCKARKSVAAFKVREGMIVGLKVTLRKARMYEFFDRLINIALPRVRDFRGISRKSFDGLGNFSFGINDFSVFPEFQYHNNDKNMGMDITVVTSSKEDKKAEALLRYFNFPIQGEINHG